MYLYLLCFLLFVRCFLYCSVYVYLFFIRFWCKDYCHRVATQLQLIIIIIILRKVLTEKDKRANVGTRDRGTINNKDRIAATVDPLGTWFVSGIYVLIPCIKETMLIIIIIIIYILGSESPICCKLDTVSCIHILTYSCNIVQEVA